jgi:hypothetical protein
MSIEGMMSKRLRKEVKVEERAGGLMSGEKGERRTWGEMFSKIVNSGCGERSMRGEMRKEICMSA